jgi:polysulfide reductase chain C
MNEIHWGLPIAIYLFLAGLSAGAFFFTALMTREIPRRDDGPEQTIALMVPVMLAIGILMLILDLGQKASFWTLLISFRFVSPMSLGAWILIFFSILTVIWALLFLPKRFRSLIPQKMKWILELEKMNRQKLGFWGSALAVLVAVYTGVLLSSAAVPLWNWMLPVLFLFSSLSTGLALGFLTNLTHGSWKKPMDETLEKRWIPHYRYLLLGQLLAVFAFLLLAYLTQPAEVLLHLVSGKIGFLWWSGALGACILFPFIMTYYKVESPWIFSGAIIVELAGAFIMRWSVLIAGQV